MALLTAEDVLNKKFQSVKFREGYDQVEVDEFLDEVVATIYALQVENNELKEKLAAAEAQLEQGASAPERMGGSEQTPAPVLQQITDLPVKKDGGPEEASSMLALAQRLHDEYVNDGRTESEKIVSDAKVQSSRIIQDAEEKRDSVLADLDRKRDTLEAKINNLRSFEADYRKSLSEHLNKLLAEVRAEG